MRVLISDVLSIIQTKFQATGCIQWLFGMTICGVDVFLCILLASLYTSKLQHIIGSLIHEVSFAQDRFNIQVLSTVNLDETMPGSKRKLCHNPTEYLHDCCEVKCGRKCPLTLLRY